MMKLLGGYSRMDVFHEMKRRRMLRIDKEVAYRDVTVSLTICSRVYRDSDESFSVTVVETRSRAL